VESGTLARIRAIITGTNVAPPLPLLFIPGAANISLAWAIFFVALAVVYTRDAGTESDEQVEQRPFEKDSVAEREPELAMAAPRAEAEREPKGGDDVALPAVKNVAEAKALLDKGNELYTMGHYEQAVAHFDEAIRLHPRLAGAWAAKGLACSALGRDQEAIRCYDESLRINPRDAAVWDDKGNSLFALGRLEGALNCFNEALIVNPRDERAWYNMGICLANLGRPEEALARCNKATDLDPSFAAAWQAKALVLERLSRTRDAIAAYKQFISLASESDAASAEKVRQHVSELEAAMQRGV